MIKRCDETIVLLVEVKKPQAEMVDLDPSQSIDMFSTVVPSRPPMLICCLLGVRFLNLCKF